MARYCLFGDSYIKRMKSFCQGDLNLPGTATFIYKGGLRTDTVSADMIEKLKKEKPSHVFLSIGGNDISPVSKPYQIYQAICALVKEFEDAGAEVLISEILPRGDFSRSTPKGLTWSKFEKDRKQINRKLVQTFGKRLVTFKDIKCPRNYLKDMVDLSISRDGFIHFGDKVSLRCPGALDKTKYFAHVDPRADCQLAVVPQINKILYSQKFEAPCNVAGSRECEPNLRSTFVIKSKDGTRDGEPLRYNQVFYLSTMDNEGGNLLLQSDRVSLHKSPNKSRHQELCLVAEASPLTEWKILHKKPKSRFEYEGVPVPANEKVIINHVVTNQDLCVEEEIITRTSFGTREYELTACTMLDSHRAEKEQNHWMVVMGVPGDDIYPVQSQNPPLSSQESTSS